jgi:hypothetical protein
MRTDGRTDGQTFFPKPRWVLAELFHADGRTDGRTDGQTDKQTDRQTYRFPLSGWRETGGSLQFVGGLHFASGHGDFFRTLLWQCCIQHVRSDATSLQTVTHCRNTPLQLNGLWALCASSRDRSAAHHDQCKHKSQIICQLLMLNTQY